MNARTPLAAAVTLLALAATACGGQDEAADETDQTDQTHQATAQAAGQDVDPDDFTDTIDNPYMPLKPGAVWHYEGTSEDGPEEDVVKVTDRHKEILGVSVVVVRDTVSRDGEVVEDTFDWFAQDREGNVWYFGEDSREYENGKVVSTEGSWEAGKDGAEPGIVMEADPQVGDTYQQEVAPGVAEDEAKVLSLTETVEVQTGSYEDVLKTRDSTPLEPDVVEHKYYAKDVGLIREEQVEGGSEEFELVRVEGL